MSREYESRLNWWIIVPVAVVALLVAVVLLRVFLFPGSLEENAAPQTSPSAESITDPQKPPSNTDELEEYEPEIPKVDKNDCRNFMNTEEYTTFMKRLYQFEVISRMQPSDERLELIYPYATEAFMDTQEGFYQKPIVENVSILVDEKSSMGCAMESETEIIARITPIVTTIQTNEDGTQIVLHGPITIPVVHFTRWVLLDGNWYVTQERF
jgi:hypothetical protein